MIEQLMKYIEEFIDLLIATMEVLSDITFKWNHLLNAKNGVYIEEGKFSSLGLIFLK